MLSTLQQRIETRAARAGVIGLGYVGLPVACMLAQSGFSVTGVDINAEKVANVNRGITPFGGEEPGLADLIASVTASDKLRATTDTAELHDAEVILICVDTPIDHTTHLPGYRGLRGALQALGAVLADGALVIVESTIAPGTMARVVIPELEAASGKKAGADFYVGHCPERVTPGLLLNNLIKMNRAVGGQTPEVARAMVALYQSYVTGELDPTDPLTAELVKTAENAYRDVQIAFANEVAQVCEALGANVYEVRDLLNKSPGRAMLLPGAGVGGHCIPKDPWLMIANVGEAYRARLIPAARAVNDAMPSHVARLVERGLAQYGVSIQGARVAVLGYAFREETDDDRESPSEYLVKELERLGAIPVVHDPYVRAYQTALEDAISGANAAVIMVAHRAYRALDLPALRAALATPVLVDGRNAVDLTAAREAGLTYLGVGNNPHPPTPSPIKREGEPEQISGNDLPDARDE